MKSLLHDARRERQHLSLAGDSHQFLLELADLWMAPGEARDTRLAGLRRLLTFLGADALGLALYDHFSGRFELACRLGRQRWPDDLWAQVMFQGRAPLQGGLLAIPAAATGQAPMGVLALMRAAAPFDAKELRLMRRVGALLARTHQEQRLRQLMRIMAETYRKERPIDLYRFLLIELQHFICSDHSAAVMALDRENNRLIVRQELVAPDASAARLPQPRLTRLPPELVQRLASAPAGVGLGYAFFRAQPGAAWQGNAPFEQQPELAQALAYGESAWRREGREGHREIGATDSEVTETPGVRSREGGILAVPLIYEGALWGLLKMSTLRGAPPCLPPTDQQIVQQIAGRLAQALFQSDRFYRRQLELEAVRAIGQTTTNPASLEVVCQATLEAALKTLDLNVGQVQTRLRLTHGQPVLMRSVRTPDVAPQPFSEFEAPVWRSGEPALHHHLPAPADGSSGSRIMRAVLVMPIRYEDAVIGLISVQSSLQERFGQAEQDFLQTVAHEAALALKTAQLYEETHQAAQERQARQAQLQELMQAFDLRTEQLFHVSHELRAPLAYARNVTENLLAGKLGALNDKQRDRLDKLSESLKRQERQIEHLLQVSKLEAVEGVPAMELEMERIGVRDLLQQARRRGARSAQKKGVRLDVGRQLDARLTVWGDRHALEQVLDNLIENSVKFTPEGGGIVLACEAIPGWVCITVSDSGVGVSEEFQARVFEKFARGPDAQRERTPGLGLGLYICREIVQRHEGSIELHRGPEGGTIVTVLLPQ